MAGRYIVLQFGSQSPHNHAMHRMPNPPLRSGFVTGDGGRYVVPTMLESRVLINI